MLPQAIGWQTAPLAVVADPYCEYDPHFASVVLLLHLDGADGSTTITDSSPVGRACNVVGTTTLSATDPMFGTACLTLDGSTQYAIVTNTSTDFDLSTLDFTIDAQVKPADVGSGRINSIVNNRQLAGDRGFYLAMSSTGVLTFNAWDASGVAFAQMSAAAVLSEGEWQHVEVGRSGSNWYLFVGGAKVAETTSATAIGNAAQATHIGRDPDVAGRDWEGSIDEVRITRGVCRHTDNFAPPLYAHCDGSNGTAYVAAPVPPSPPLPPIPEPIAFSAVTRASLFGVVGSAISSTTLATITCADAAMTVAMSHAVPGLTFSYASNVLSVSGTPNGPSSLTRVVVTYIASDGSNSVRGSTEHEITIVDASEVLTIGSMAGASGRVGVPLTATLASPSTNYEVDVHITPNGSIAGLTPALAWTVGSGSASGTLTLSGTPTLAGSYSLSVDYFGFGVNIGTSTHAIVIAAAYQPPAPAPSPTPAPPAPIPSPPPAPTPAPAPGRGPDTLFPYVKVLMHFDSATGIATDVKGNTFTNRGATLGTGAVSEGAIFTSAATRIEGSVAGIDGSSGTLCVEAMVDIDATAWAALMDGSLTDNRFCPVMTLIDSGGEVVWTLGFASTRNLTGPAGRHVRPTMFNALTGFQFGYPVGSQCAVTHAYPELKARPGRFVHLAATRRANPVSPTDDSYDQGTWFDGLAGGQRRVPYISLLKTTATGTLRIGGACPRIEYVIAEVMQRDVTIVPFSGAIDELRITAYQRYLSYLFPGLLALGQQVSAIPAHARVIPWSNY